MKQIPNLFTLLNLIFGCIAIVYVMQSGLAPLFNRDGSPDINSFTGVQYIGFSEKIWMASLFIGLAAVVDFFDGFIARLFNASSEMGKQLDSLADVVSFGVAPGIIMYQFLRLSYAQQVDGLDTSTIGLFVAFIIPAAVAYRLARFNLDSAQQYSFKGVPVPAVGLLIASLPLIYWNVNEGWVVQLLLNKWFLYGVILLVSYLMISDLPMLSLKFKDFSFANNWPKYFLIFIAIVAALLLKWLAAPVIFIAYVLVSLFFKNKNA